MRLRTYSDLRRLDSLEERYEYLALGAEVGRETFGFDRWMNQEFYHSREWRLIRNHVITRDRGFDLGADEAPLRGSPRIHHMNPLTVMDIEDSSDNLLDPEFLISASLRVHNAIHYGNKSQLPQAPVERRPGDTLLW